MDFNKLFKSHNGKLSVNIIHTDEGPLFQASHIGEILGLKNIHSTIQNYDETMKVKRVIDTANARRQMTFLTITGLHKVIFNSKTTQANKLQTQIRESIAHNVNNLKETINKLENEKILLSTFRNLEGLYVCLLDNYKNINDTDKSVYKIAYTRDFRDSRKEIEEVYGPVTLLKLFKCWPEFEEVICESEMSKYICETNFVSPETEEELFLLSQDDLKQVLNYIEINHTKYQPPDEERALDDRNWDLRLQLVKLQLSNLCAKMPYQNSNVQAKTEINTQTGTNDSNHINETSLSDVVPDEPPEYEWKEGDTLFDVVPIANTKSPYIQKYDATTFELLETFDSIIDLTRHNQSITYYGLKTAAKNNSVYVGFRWLFVPKDKPNIKYDLGPTKHVPYTQPNQLIAMLDIDKSKIMEVYPSQKHAALSRKFNSFAPITQALKNGTISGGHYWKRYDECSPELKATYTNPLPEKIKKPNGSRKVHIIHKSTKEIVKTYDSVKEVMTAFQMSRRKLNEVCATKEVYKNWIFQIVE